MYVFITDSETINSCRGELEKQGFNIISHELELVPYRTVDFGAGVFDKVAALMRDLQEVDQVVDVSHNVEPPREEVAASSS